MVIRGVSIFIKKFILEFKHEVQNWSFLLFRWFRIWDTEVGDGSGKDLGSAMGDSASNGFSSTSLGASSKILVRMLLPVLAETCKNEPPEAVLRSFEVFLLRPIQKC